MDQIIIFWIQDHIVTGWLSPLMLTFSSLGNLGAVWIVAGLGLLATKRYRRAGLAVLIGLLLSLIIGNGLLKHLVMRARPCIDFPNVPMLLHVPAANDFSFPSGHTFGSFAAAAAMFGGLKRRWGIAGLMLAGAIGFSRIYLFMHYPTDVAAGAVLGMISGYAAWKAAGNLLNWWEQRQSAAVGEYENGEAEDRSLPL